MAMKKAKVTLHPAYRIGDISKRLFGAFLEPIGSMVNGSMYNPKHPTADEQGLRRDFYEGLKDAGFPEENIHVMASLDEAIAFNRMNLRAGDVVMYENDLPDHYSEG